MATALRNDWATASVVGFLCDDGTVVQTGQPVVQLESMKVMYTGAAPSGGRVRFRVTLGQIVNAGDLLAEIEEA